MLCLIKRKHSALVFYNVKQIIPLCSSNLCKYFSKGTVLEPRAPTWSVSSAKPYTVRSLNHQPRGSSKLCGEAPPPELSTPSPTAPPPRILSTPHARLSWLLFPESQTQLPTSTPPPSVQRLPTSRARPMAHPVPSLPSRVQGPPSSSAPSSVSTHSRPGSPPFRKTVGVDARLADSPAIAREPPAHSCGTLEGLQPVPLPPERRLHAR